MGETVGTGVGSLVGPNDGSIDGRVDVVGEIDGVSLGDCVGQSSAVKVGGTLLAFSLFDE